MSGWVLRGVRPLGADPTDLYVDNGVLVDAPAAGAETLDASGLIALPGLVDLHTHLREPGREDAETVETGTRAAALGGFTAVHAMANTDPVADTAGVVEQVWRLGREAGYCDVFPVGAVPVGLAGRRRGGDHRPRLPARRPRRLPAARLPRLDGRLGRDPALGQGQGLERHRGSVPAPPAADRRAGGDLRPDLQGQPAAAHRGRR